MSKRDVPNSGAVGRMIAILALAVVAVLGTFATAARAANHPPVFTSVPPAGATAGVAWVYLVTTADPDPNDRPRVAVVEKPSWLTFVRKAGGGARLRGTPTLARVGVHRVRLRVTDVHGARTIQRFDVVVVPPAAAAPLFSPGGGSHPAPVAVTIAAPTPGSSIRYTTDGSDPSATAGEAYAGPIDIGTPTTLKAIAFGPGLADSPVTTADYAFVPGVETLPLTAIGTDGGTIRGAVDPRGLPTRAWFEWGTDPLLRAPDATERVALGDGTTTVAIARVLSGPASGTTYYYRVVAENEAGVSRGATDYFAPEPLDDRSIVVNSADDPAVRQPGKMTIRAAVERIASGGTITFDLRLSGARIDLAIVGEEDTILKGEVFNPGFLGYQERNYGKSALYARKSLIIDAAALPGGITLAWTGGEANPARVLAVYGNVRLRNVAVTGGRSVAEAIPGSAQQPWTLARGGGIAVWGIASLEGCTIHGNGVAGDLNGSRDRGAFGGGVYADWLFVSDCVVSGNTARGYGAAGGGLYSVGGTDYAVSPEWEEPLWDNLGSRVMRTTVSGNRVTAQHAYGGGVYSDGGGPGNLMTLQIEESTLARNLVEAYPGLPAPPPPGAPAPQHYYRGGGAYMSNGYLWIHASTIAENEVRGYPAMFSGKPNMAGGGITATIGNAHVVEDITLWHTIIAGNRAVDLSVDPPAAAPADVGTGSLLHFYSSGYNLVGAMDFTWMLVPIPEWMSLSRRHWPQQGDAEGIDAAAVLDIAGAARSATVVSAGTDAGEPALLWYPPAGDALDRIPPESYPIYNVYAGYYPYYDAPEPSDDFLAHVVDKLQEDAWLGPDFGPQFDGTAGIPFVADGGTWPANPTNAPWIRFWRDLDAEIGDRLGSARLGDAFWLSFSPDAPGGSWYEGIALDENITLYLDQWEVSEMWRNDFDQLGVGRSTEANTDIGAVEMP